VTVVALCADSTLQNVNVNRWFTVLNVRPDANAGESSTDDRSPTLALAYRVTEKTNLRRTFDSFRYAYELIGTRSRRPTFERAAGETAGGVALRGESKREESLLVLFVVGRRTV